MILESFERNSLNKFTDTVQYICDGLREANFIKRTEIEIHLCQKYVTGWILRAKARFTYMP